VEERYRLDGTAHGKPFITFLAIKRSALFPSYTCRGDLGGFPQGRRLSHFSLGSQSPPEPRVDRVARLSNEVSILYCQPPSAPFPACSLRFNLHLCLPSFAGICTSEVSPARPGGEPQIVKDSKLTYSVRGRDCLVRAIITGRSILYRDEVVGVSTDAHILLECALLGGCHRGTAEVEPR
jgi:hypothetical protein